MNGMPAEERDRLFLQSDSNVRPFVTWAELRAALDILGVPAEDLELLLRTLSALRLFARLAFADDGSPCPLATSPDEELCREFAASLVGEVAARRGCGGPWAFSNRERRQRRSKSFLSLSGSTRWVAFCPPQSLCSQLFKVDATGQVHLSLPGASEEYAVFGS